MKVSDILSLCGIDNDISICEQGNKQLTEMAIITYRTPIDDYERILKKFADKEVKHIYTDISNTITIVY